MILCDFSKNGFAKRRVGKKRKSLGKLFLGQFFFPPDFIFSKILLLLLLLLFFFSLGLLMFFLVLGREKQLHKTQKKKSSLKVWEFGNQFLEILNLDIS